MDSALLRPSARRGVVLLEATISVVLAGLVLGMVSLLLAEYARTTDYYVNYRRAQLAAESCIELIRAGAIEPRDTKFVDDANIAYEIALAPASGEWQPLVRVRVTASIEGRHGRVARYRLSSFVSPPPSEKGDAP